MMTIDILPQDIFQHIQTFLSNGDYHYFLNSSKKFCEDLKRKTFFFKLTKEKSVEYVMNKEFQDLLLSKVENGWNQIGIICSHLFISNIPIDLPICKISVSNDQLPFHLWNNYKSIDCRFYGGAKGIPLFPTVKDLFLRVMLAGIKETPMIDLRLFSHLSSFRVNDLKVKDVTALKDIPHLYLSSCTELTDFTVLSNQRELTLHQCRGLTDVTSFRSIRKLSISYCENVSDVSPLKGIYDLTLQGCSNIKDISCLGNHHRLSVSTISSGFDVLLHIPHVTLMSCDIDDLDVLRFAKSVSLGQCQKIKSVSPLKTVKKVMILNSGESGFTELGEVPDLSLSLRSGYKLNDESIACFKSKRLILTNSTRINTLEVFSSSIQHLHIGESEDFAKLINDGQGVLLQHLLSLTLDKLSVVRLEGLGLIPTVRLVRCNALQTMKGLGSNRCVVVDVCSALKDLSSLASVPIVTIKYCARLTITDYECLKNVPRLKILVD